MYGVDYTEVFSSTAKMSSVRIVFTLDAQLDWGLHCKGISVHLLTYHFLSYDPPHLSLSICILPIPLHHLQGAYSEANDCLEVDSLDVVNFLYPPLLVPQLHWMSLRHIGIGLHDTMAPSAVTWTPTHERLGTRRLGTVTLCISFVG
jgi:hypothetical protein